MAFLKKRYHFIIFAVFLGMELAILSQMTFYGDDYYYMTFFDGGFKNFVALNVTHYTEVNGRAIVHLIAELLLADRTLWAFRVATVAVIGCTVYLAAFIASGCRRDEKMFPPALCTVCVLFCLINVGMANQTLYWATGAVNYLYPIPVTLFYYTVYKKFARTGTLPKWTPSVAFFASALIEQCAFASLIITGLIIYTYVLNKKKADVVMILTAVLSVVGIALLYFAPGNAVRQTFHPEFYSLPLYKRIIQNVRPLFSLIFSAKGAAGALCAYAISCGAAALARKQKLHVIVAAVNFTATLALVLRIALPRVSAIGYAAAGLTVLALGLNIVSAFARFVGGDADGVFFTLVPAVLQAAMLISPIYGPRTVLCSVVLIFVQTARNVVETVSHGFEVMRRVARVAVAVLLAAAGITLFAVGKIPMLAGYARNNVIQKYNMEYVAQALEKSAKKVVILYLPDENCRYTMPYDSTYHEYWFKVAFGLPVETEIVYDYRDR